jgi:hypothetical protein
MDHSIYEFKTCGSIKNAEGSYVEGKLHMMAFAIVVRTGGKIFNAGNEVPPKT